MPTKQDEINKWIDDMFEEHGFENTDDNRLAAMEGLLAAWNEDPTTSLEKTLYKVALTGMMSTIKTKMLISGGV